MAEWKVTKAYVGTKCSLGEGPYYSKEHHQLRFVDINNHKLHVIDLNKGPSSLTTIDTGMPVGVTADLDGVDSREVILTGAKDGVTKFNLKTGEHTYVAKYWSGPDAEDKTRRYVEDDFSPSILLTQLIVCDPTMAPSIRKEGSGWRRSWIRRSLS